MKVLNESSCEQMRCVISGFRRGANKVSPLLEFYAVLMVVYYRRFEKPIEPFFNSQAVLECLTLGLSTSSTFFHITSQTAGLKKKY
jgi:hypothetical protein